MKRKFQEQNAITLIALIITIIILLILAGITINFMLGDNGILNKATSAGEKYEEQAARERLEIALLDLAADKVTNSEYNETTFIDNRLTKENMTVEGDIVTVDGWKFEIDRSVPKIAKSMGNGEVDLPVNNEIIITANATTGSDYATSTIKAEITYAGEITSITIAGEEITVPEKTEDKYIVEKQVDKNGTFKIVAKDEKNSQQTASITISEITEDMDIYTKADLESFRDKVNKGATFAGRTVRLMSDIDLQGSASNPWKTIGDLGTDKNHYFAGIFEGNKHTISNIYIDEPSTSFLGLFGVIKNAEIKQLKLNNGMIKGTNCAGGIVGKNENSTVSDCSNNVTVVSGDYAAGISGTTKNGKIINCYNTGAITAPHTAGGITAMAGNDSEISNCYNTGTIRTTTSDSPNGVYLAGGVVGASENIEGNTTIINNCYNIGDVFANGYTGGVVGLVEGGGTHIITNCYNTGNLTGNGTIYAVTGEHGTYNGAPQTNISNNYWITGCGATYGSYQNLNTETKELTANELKSYANALGEAYDTDTNNQNNGYPILKWQK